MNDMDEQYKSFICNYIEETQRREEKVHPMQKLKKALSTIAIMGMVATLVPVNVLAAGMAPVRISGDSAEQTAVAIANQTGWTATAILASSASYGMVDALTAGPLASYLKAPILLQQAGPVLNADTRAELAKLKVKTVYVVSGTSVISQAVLNELRDTLHITVVPLGGHDQFETSVNIAKKMIALGAPVSKIAVAYGWLTQDALSIASIASNASQPILLAERTSVPQSIKAFLAANPKIISSDVIGGTSVISEAVKNSFPSATRHFGNSAYDTNKKVIQDFTTSLVFDQVYLANGVTGIDALAGAPLAAKTKSPIVLTDGVETVPVAATFVNSKMTSHSVATALGGTAVVSNKVLAELHYNPAASVAVSSVSTVAARNVSYGTTVANVGLPAKITLNLSNNTTEEVGVTWTNANYDGTKTASYTFTGAYALPGGVTGTRPAVTATVVVGVNPDLADIDAARVAVTALETAAAKNLAVEAELTGAEAKIQPAKDAVAKVNEATEKAKLTVRVADAETTVTVARTAFDTVKAYAELKTGVVTKVTAYTNLANGDLSTQALVNAANTAKAAISLEGLTAEDTQTLQGAVEVANAKVTAAQILINAAVAIAKIEADAETAVAAYEEAPVANAVDITKAEALEITAKSDVDLVKDTTKNAVLTARIATKKAEVDVAKAEFGDIENAKAAVTALETAANANLLIEVNLTVAEAAVTAANITLAKVVAVDTIVILQARISVAAKTVNDARTAFDAVTAYAELKASVVTKVTAYTELANGNLSTQELVDAANTAKAAISLDGLNAVDTETLQAAMEVATTKVTAAQTVLDAEVAVAEYEAAPIVSVDDVTAAHALEVTAYTKVDLLLDGSAKDALTERIASKAVLVYAVLKAQIYVKIDAYTALANGDLSTQTLVTAAKDAGELVNLTGLELSEYFTARTIVDAANNKVAIAQIDVTVAQPVKDAIATLQVPVTLTDKDSVEALRVAFTRLTGTQQALITNVAKLIEAEATIAQLVATAKIEADAEGAVVAYEAAPVTSVAEVAAAEALEVTAEAVVVLVKNTNKNAALTARIATKKAEVDVAKAEFGDIENAQVAVTTLEVAANTDLAVKANLEAAEAAVTAANEALANVDAGTAKVDLQEKVTIAAKTITDARTAFDAAVAYAELKAGVITKVTAYTDLANDDLSTQGLIDVANIAKAAISLEGLTAEDTQTLQATMDVATAKVTAAQTVLDAAAIVRIEAKAETSVAAYEAAAVITTADVTAAEALEVTAKADVALVTDTTKNAFLGARIATRKAAVDVIKAELVHIETATAAVNALEAATAKNLTVGTNLTGAEALLQPAKDAVAKINDATEKAALAAKVAAAEKTVTDARTAFDAVAAADYTYTVISGNAQITKYTGAGGTVTMPNTLDGLPVTSIGYGAFKDCTDLTSISIPQGVTSIGSFAFYGCTGLTSIIIPQGVTSIGDYTFFGCTGITSIIIPQIVTSIGDYTFYGCTGLMSINIPQGITDIGEGAFSGCAGLDTISIPEGVTSIGSYAFSGCAGLTSISISQGVKSIGDYAFAGCAGLTSIIIPQGVTSIGNGAFSSCGGLTSISIPQGVTSISEGTFANSTGLTSIIIPQGVTSIGPGAFQGCTGLTSIIIPQGVTSIGNGAFSYCYSLTGISIPQGVTSINYNAFAYCSGLTSISLPEGVTSISYNAFQGCTRLTSIILPKAVTNISYNAFEGCTRLTSISIPQAVTSIGHNAFSNCSALTSIIFNSSTTTIFDSADTIPGTTKIIGYATSTAKDYAAKYLRTFVVISAVTSVSLNKATDGLIVGGTDNLSAMIAPSTATNQAVTWASSDNTIATVDHTGKVTAIGAGTATVTATVTVTTVDGSKTASCIVTVEALRILSIDDITANVLQDSIYNLPSTVTANMNDGNTLEIEVLWNPTVVDTSNVGTFTFDGVVDGYDTSVKLTLNVNAPILRPNLNISNYSTTLGEVVSKSLSLNILNNDDRTVSINKIEVYANGILVSTFDKNALLEADLPTDISAQQSWVVYINYTTAISLNNSYVKYYIECSGELFNYTINIPVHILT